MKTRLVICRSIFYADLISAVNFVIQVFVSGYSGVVENASVFIGIEFVANFATWFTCVFLLELMLVRDEKEKPVDVSNGEVDIA